MATTTISPVITDAGKAAAISANGAGLSLQITHVCLGTARYTPATSATAMGARVEKASIGAGVSSGGSLKVSVLFPGRTTGYDVTEIGFYAGDPDAGGTLFAVWSVSSGALLTRSDLDYVATFSLSLSQIPASSVTILVDSSSNLALLAALHTHEMNSADPHAAAGYAKKVGVQGQEYTAGLTTGTGAAYALTVAPTVAGLKKFHGFHCCFHATSTSDVPTLNVSGLGAKALMVYDSTGTKSAPPAGAIAAGQHADVVYDGTDFVITTPLPTRAGTNILLANISSNPAFTSGGLGTAVSPLVIPAANSISGATGEQVARITVTGLRPGEFVLIGDTSETANGTRFTVSNRIANGSGTLIFDIKFNDAPASVAGTTHPMTLRVNNLLITHNRGITAAVSTNTPSITAPTQGATGIAQMPTFASSAFAVTGGSDTHAGSDWQASSDASFATIVASSTSDATNKTSWTPTTALAYLTTFYVRVRHRGTVGGASAWSSAVSFTTRAAPSVNAPSFTAPAATGAATQPTFTTTAFSVTGGADNHVSTDWQVATDYSFFNVVAQSVSDSVNKTAWTPAAALANATTYYARVRHKGTALGLSSWSTVLTFTTTAAAVVNAPSITTPANNASGISPFAAISASAFSVSNGTDAHASTDWQAATDSAFLNIVAQSIGDTTNKTTWTPSGLAAGSSYFVRVRYSGTRLGVTAYSSGVKFTTLSVSAPTITAPADGATGTILKPTITTSAFSNTGSDTHLSTDWIVASDAGFASVSAQSIGDTTNKTSWTLPSNLAGSTKFYVRARHRGTTGVYSAYSATVSFTTQAVVVPAVTAPSITSPASGAAGVKGPIQSSAFAVTNGTDIHAGSDWQAATDSAFFNIVAQSTADSINKVSWTPSGLSGGSTYFVRVRHIGTTIGASAWSAGVSFVWIATNAPSITSPAANATGIATGATITASAFSSTGADSHSSSDWQVAADIAFGTVIKQALSDTTNKTTWTPGGLSASTTYYARVRYRGAAGGLSSYSSAVKFTTASAAGVTWSYKAIPSPALRGAAYGAGKWVLVGYGAGGWTGEGSIWTTTDFQSFTQQADRFSHTMGMLWSVIWTGSKFVSVGFDIDGADQTGKIMVSADGITWTAIPTTAAPKDVAWNGTRLVAVGYDTSNLPYSWVSTNGGTTWTRTAIPSTVVGGLLTVEWHAGLGLFIAGGMGTDRAEFTSPGMASSPDGVTWTAITAPAGMGMIREISTNGTMLVAVGHTSAGTETAGAICTSTDGKTWTKRSFSGGVLTSVISSNNQWVVCGKTTAGTLAAGGIWTSTDSGVTWTSRTIDSGALFGMAAANNLFVTVGHTKAGTLTAGAIYTSPSI